MRLPSFNPVRAVGCLTLVALALSAAACGGGEEADPIDAGRTAGPSTTSSAPRSDPPQRTENREEAGSQSAESDRDADRLERLRERLKREGLSTAERIAIRDEILGRGPDRVREVSDKRMRAYLQARRKIVDDEQAGEPSKVTPEEFEAFLKARKQLLDR